MSAGVPEQRSVAELRRDRPPARIVHLGLGAFARAHTLWYTDTASDAAEWGITGFTGRSPRQAQTLAEQDGVYTVIERGETDESRVVDALVAARDGTDGAALAAAIADPACAIVTLTITERGYDERSAVLGRLAAALDARRSSAGGSGGGPLALVPCDNLPGNAGVLRSRLLESASPELAAWIAENVSFVSTVVDRITPATTEADVRAASELVGARDAAPVVTEPFTEWTLAGDFPVGRPAWETRGAEFVDDVEPYEKRKLWMLNAAHSLLAYRGLALGLTTVAEAMADPGCRAAVDALWADAAEVLPFERSIVDAYAAALVSRFENARIEHRLEQIARDGSAKLGPRILDPLRARREAGLPAGEGELVALDAWRSHVLAGRAADDPGAPALLAQLEKMKEIA